ncbi:hypothetical protein MMPV_009959 [Pyropia vietnamensis]
MFRDVFDCESYSLVNKSLTYGSREAHTLGRRKKDVAQSFGVRSEWDGTPPLKVLQFLRKFAKACDDNDVSEAEAFFMLQDFTKEPLRSEVMSVMPSRHGGNPVPAKIVVNNPMFRDVFDCESYSLVNKSLTYGSREAHTLGRRKKDVAQSFGVRSEWDGTPPLKVFQFLRKFAKACDDNDVSEAEAFFMLQDFTKEPLRSEVMSVMPSRHGGNPGREYYHTGEVNSYLELINWMLRYHADEASLAAQVEEFNRATQTPGY